MQLKNFDAITIIRYILGSATNVLNDISNMTLVVSARGVYALTLHIRFSQLFYRSSLILLSGFDALNGKSVLTYVYLLNGATHLKVLCLVSNKNRPASIEDLYINSSWYEREVSEALGIKFLNSSDTRTLLLPYNNTTNPLKKLMPSNSTSMLGYSRMSESISWMQL